MRCFLKLAAIVGQPLWVSGAPAFQHGLPTDREQRGSCALLRGRLPGIAPCAWVMCVAGFTYEGFSGPSCSKLGWHLPSHLDLVAEERIRFGSQEKQLDIFETCLLTCKMGITICFFLFLG